jgi:hypothetical protein
MHRHPPIARDEQARLLDGVIARVGEVGARALCAFDLDSTIFDNRPRQARILREYGRARGLAALEQARPEHFTSWSLVEAMRAAGLGADDAVAHADDARTFWRARFFSSAYCPDDRAIAGAADFLAALRAGGAQIAYVTGRHVAMGAGSRAAMAACGFPLPDGRAVHLLLKPAFEDPDDEWKIAASEQLPSLGELVAAFDNEPAHINVYARRFPAAHAIHLATDHSGRDIPLLPGVVSVADLTR